MILSVDIKKKLGSFFLNVSFQADQNILGLLGASGCGKSMTLKCIAGIVTPDEGRITLGDRVLFDSAKKINLPPQKRLVSYLFQNYALFPNMTVRQNIACGVRGSKAAGQQIINQKIKALYLEGLEDKYPSQLSGGQQQRVALARILVNEPLVIMLDEPFSALDSYLKWQLEMELISNLEEFSGVTLFVSHNRDEIYRICDQVCIIDNGKSEPIVKTPLLFDKPKTLSAALLTGCKNYSQIRDLKNGFIEAVDWGVTLACAEPVPKDACYIGVRAHYLTPVASDGQNTIPCRILRITQDVFSTIVMLRPFNSPNLSDFANLRIEMKREEWAALGAKDELFVHIHPYNIMFLR